MFRLRIARKPATKTVCVKNFDCTLYAAAKAQAKAEGMRISDWIERALTRELARSHQQAAAATAPSPKPPENPAP